MAVASGAEWISPTPVVAKRDPQARLLAEIEAHGRTADMLRASMADRDALAVKLAELEAQVEALTAPPVKRR